MRILEVLGKNPGETFIQEHVRSLSQHGSEIKLAIAFTETTYFKSIPEKEKAFNCPHIIFPNLNRISKPSKVKMIISAQSLNAKKAQIKLIKKRIKKFKPDLIHFQFASIAFKWSSLIQELKIPYTFSVRGSDIQILPHTLSGYTEEMKVLGQDAAGIHTVTNDLARVFEELTGVSNATTIRTVIDPSWESFEKKPSPGQFLAIGRLHWCKNYIDLVLAAKILKDHGCFFYIRIAGDGDRQEELEFLIDKFGLQDNFQLLGRKSPNELKKLLSSTQFIVQPSLMEGFPNSIGESMVAGIPFIASKCAGIIETIPENNSSLVEIGNEINLAEVMMRELNSEPNDDFLSQIKEKALNLFSPPLHAENFISFWESSLKKSGFTYYKHPKTETNHRSNKSQVHVVTVGPLEWQMGYVLSLKVFDEVRVEMANDVELIYHIVGEGKDENFIKPEAFRRNMTKNLKLYKGLNQEEIIEILKKSDVFLAFPFIQQEEEYLSYALESDLEIIVSEEYNHKDVIDTPFNGLILPVERFREAIPYLKTKVRALIKNH